MNPLRQQMDADMVVRRMSERTREACLNARLEQLQHRHLRAKVFLPPPPCAIFS
jgi:hypothetical protein